MTHAYHFTSTLKGRGRALWSHLLDKTHTLWTYSQVSGRTNEFLVDGVALASLLLGDSKSPVSSLASFDSTPAERERRHLIIVCVEGK